MILIKELKFIHELMRRERERERKKNYGIDQSR
jgi:hypothetical protein